MCEGLGLCMSVREQTSAWLPSAQRTLTTAIKDSGTVSLCQKLMKTKKALLLLMSLQSRTHVQHNRNQGTMHNMTISDMRQHKTA